MKALVVKNGNQNHNIKLHECISHFNISTPSSVLVEYEIAKEEQFGIYIERVGTWNSYYKVKLSLGHNPLLLRSFFRKVEKILKEHGPFDLFIGGNYMNILTMHLSNYFASTKCIYLDEGNSTIAYHKLREANSLNFSKKDPKRFFFKKLIYKLVGIKFFHPKRRVYFFSVYGLDNTLKTTFVLNTFKTLKIELSKQAINKNQVLLIGGPYVDKGYMSFVDYMAVLSKIKERFLGCELVYFPHKRESKEILKKLKKSLGVLIVNSPLFLEDYLINGNNIPEHIVVIISSAIDNLVLMYDEKVNFYSIKLDSLPLLKGKDIFQDVFEYHDRYQAFQNFSYID